MPDSQVVEPFGIECEILIVGGKQQIKSLSNSYENKREIPLTRDQIRDEIRRLIEVEKHSINAAAEKCHLSPITVRRACRTLKIGPYSAQEGGKRSRSSQIPYGWSREAGHLFPNTNEVRWIQFMKRLRESGSSYAEIADQMNKIGIPSKNGKTWDRRTIWKILKTGS